MSSNQSSQSRDLERPTPSSAGLSFDFLRQMQGSNGDDLDDRRSGLHLDQDSTSASGPTNGMTTRAESSDDEAEPPKEATQEEKDEAEAVVRTAFKEVKE